MKTNLEVPFEVKQTSEDDDFFRFEGFASTFNNTDLVDDIILPGSFRDSIAKTNPVILWQHDSSEPIGMPEELLENDMGLFIKAKLPKNDTLVSGRVIPQMKIGSIKKMSIGFRIPKGGAVISDEWVRTINKIDLHEISLVTFPANPMASVTGLKKITALQELDEFETQREFERYLRDSGLFSKAIACKIASSIKTWGSHDDGASAKSDNTDEELFNLSAKLDSYLKHTQLTSMLKKLR